MSKKNFFVPLLYLLVSCTQNFKTTRSDINEALNDKDLTTSVNIILNNPSITNLSQYHDQDGNNILHLIIEKNDIDTFKLLSSKTEIQLPYNRYNNDYETPASMAINLDKCQLLELLLIKGADPLMTTNNHPTLLIESILNKRYPCMESLLIQNKQTLEQKSFNNWQALHYASYLNDIKSAHILLAYHPALYTEAPVDTGVPFYNNDIIMGVGDLNPFALAIVKGNLAVAQLLLKYEPNYIKTTTSNGTNNLQLAQLSKSEAMIDWISSIEPESTPKEKIDIKPADNITVFEKGMDNINK